MDSGSVVLDLDGVAPPLAFAAPREVAAAFTAADVRGALARVEAAAAAGRWAAGFVAYEAAPALEPALSTRPPGQGPLVWFGIYDAPCAAPAPEGEARLGPLVPEIDRACYD